MATLDDALTGASKLLDQMSKQQLLGKVDASTIRMPDDQLGRRIANLTARIADLTQRQADLVASYDSAIALEQRELDALKAQATPAAPPAAGNATASPAGSAAPRQTSARARPKRNKEPK